MTKLGWYEEDQFRKTVDDASQFLEKGAAGQSGLYLLGLKLLSMHVIEMNQPIPGRTMTQHRKIAVAFRDQSLLKTFQLSLTALKQLQGTAAAETKLKEQVTHNALNCACMLGMPTFRPAAVTGGCCLKNCALVLVQAIALALACLSYDFVGTSNDDSSEDLGTIQVGVVYTHMLCVCVFAKLTPDAYSGYASWQVPSPWRPQMEDTTNMQLLFSFYSSTSPPLSSMALECLVRLLCSSGVIS